MSDRPSDPFKHAKLAARLAAEKAEKDKKVRALVLSGKAPPLPKRTERRN